MQRPTLLVASLLAASGVAAGAFGAHGLKAVLGATQMGWWQTGVQYQMWHAVALAALGLSGLSGLGRAAALLATGTLIFSGTLYAMALTECRWLGAVTPIGGILMVAGWLVLAWRAYKEKAPSR